MITLCSYLQAAVNQKVLICSPAVVARTGHSGFKLCQVRF